MSYTFVLIAQNAQKRNYFFDGEYMAGRVIPNYVENFPNTHIQQSISLSVGSFKTDTNSSWAKYFHYPQTGVTFFYSNIGNNAIYGNQFSLLPFISYKVLKGTKKPIYLKLGLGVSYFTTYYDSITNPRNVAIGSPFTWALLAGVYKTVLEKEGFNLKLGLVFSHASNGHTQLPNFGLNSLLFSLSAQFYKQEKQHYQLFKPNKTKNKPIKNYAINIKQGFGFHEYGVVDGPVGGGKKAVYATSLDFSKTYNSHLKWSFGASYLYYEHYYEQIQLNQYPQYIENPTKNASNIIVYTGMELLMKHVSMDVELGINVYKPFYEQYEKDFDSQQQFQGYSDFKDNIKRYLSTKLGLNLYLLNTSNFPTHNVLVGAHIKANSGTADYTEFNLGYIYNIK